MGWRSLLLVVFSVGWFFAAGWWIASSQRQGAPGAESADAACRLSLAGSNTIGERLAPALATAYFRAEGYSVSEPETTGEDEVRLVATRGEERCVIDVRSHGSSLSFVELTADTALVGMASRAIRTGETAALNAAGAGDFVGEAALAEHVIALDGIAIITHPSNPLRSLPRSQVRDLFLRQATNWSAVRGGGSGAIDLYARDDQSGTFQFFLEQVLEDDARWESAQPNVRRFASSSELVSNVAADPQSLGFVGMAYVNDTVRALSISDGGPAFAPTGNNVRAESYPISRRLFLYVRPSTMRDNPLVASMVAFFKSPSAYDVVEDLGYVSLREMGVGGPEVAAAEAPPCESGAPETQAYLVATRGADRLDSVIRFLPGSNDLDSLARDDVGRAANTIRTALGTGAKVTLIGHSDAQGEAEVNRRLALQRAETIREAFEAQGLMGLQMDSAGERCPIASNETTSGRQSNRRVEIWISRGA